MNILLKLVIFAVCVSLAPAQEVHVQDLNDTTPKPALTSKSLVRNETTTTTLSTTRISTPTSFNSTEEVNSTLILTYHVSGGSTNGMLQRSLYVAIGISTLVALYFIVQTLKTRGRRKAKKYGVIHGAASVELQPLDRDVDEEEEDMTLFDMKDAKRPLK